MITEGWILHTQAKGETSLRLALFTREQGVIHALFKGGRTPKNQAVAQPFLPLWVSVSQRGDWSYINRLEAMSPQRQFVGKALWSAWYVNELILAACKPQDEQLLLFDAYDEVLAQLALASNQENLEWALRQFEWQWLTALGLAFSLTQTAKGEPIEPEKGYRYVPNLGFIEAEKGILGAYLLAFSKRSLLVSALPSLKRLMRQVVHEALAGKTLRVLTAFDVLGRRSNFLLPPGR